MTTYKYKLARGGRKVAGDYKLECEYLSHGVRGEYGRTWGHRVKLYKDGIEVAKAVIPYYNRTWERYTYESAMREVLYRYKQKLVKQACEQERASTESGRLPRGFKKTYGAMIDASFKDFDNKIKDNALEWAR